MGQLQHACKVVRCDRTFVASTASKVQELEFYTRLSIALKSDLCWWDTFLKDWNGVSLFKLANKDIPADATIQTDVSGTWGSGAFFNNKNIMVLMGVARRVSTGKHNGKGNGAHNSKPWGMSSLPFQTKS